MSSLEDLLPEMAGVFAAQESALGNCVNVLTTQLQNLAQDHVRQLQRVASLEATQSALLETLTALRQQNKELQQQQATQLNDIAALQEQAGVHADVDLTGFKESLTKDIEIQAMAIVQRMVAPQLQQLETKVAADWTTQLNERLLEISHRVHMQTQASEEAMQDRLEMLEKKFDYLSKVKMEIKELGKRMDKQDQTLDDMRTGLSLLAKSVGTDEIDDEEEHRDTDEADATAAVVEEIQRSIAVTPKLMEPPETEEEAPVVVDTATEMVQLEQVTEDIQEVAQDEHIPEALVDVEEVPVTVDEVPEQKEDGLFENVPVVEVQEQKQEDESPIQIETAVVVEKLSTPSQPEPETPIEPEPPQHELEPVEELSVPEETSSVAAEPSTVSEVIESPPQDSKPVVEPPGLAPAPPPSTLSPRLADVQTEVREKSDDESTEENERRDDFHASAPVAVNVAPRLSFGPIQQLQTAPSLSTVAFIRSRRQERFAKRGSRRESALDLSDVSRPQSQRTPLSLAEIKVLWCRVFTKLVQLRRLQAINGTSPERTLFRKQNISMGARVKRLEESTNDLEDTLELLEATINGTGQTLQQLNQTVTQSNATLDNETRKLDELAHSNTTLDKKTRKLDELARMHGHSILGIEEKFEAMEAEFRRMRNVARRDSTRNSVTTTAFSQIAVQLQGLLSKLSEQGAMMESHDKLLTRVIHTDLPALTTNVQGIVLELRADIDYRTRELGKELVKAVEKMSSTQKAAEHRLGDRLEGSVDALYRDLLVLTSAILVGVELAAKQTTALASTGTRKSNHKSPLDVGIGLLQSVIAPFEGNCRRLITADDTSTEDDGQAMLAVLFEKLQHFRVELTKLKEQAEKAQTITASTTTMVSSESADSIESATTTSKTRAFEEHLVLVCTNQLRALEEILVAQSHSQPMELNSTAATITSYIKDLVIQLRAVLFLLVLHTQLVDPPQQIHALQAAHAGVETKLAEHAFSLSQLGTIEAVVKLMNARLDSFLDMSFSFAKDADVKQSIQELLNAGDELREQLCKQLDTTHAEAVQRDELIEKEVAQLAGRVHKKLDKDEMLWTQEVLERQLQNVVKGALSEDDLIDIQRALRTKMDKTQFHTLLQQQHAKLVAMAGGGADVLSLFGGGATGNQPLASTRCISCKSELPPTKSHLVEVVKEEVAHEVARALAATQARQLPASGFQISNHRSMDKHKQSLLLAALQKKQ